MKSFETTSDYKVFSDAFHKTFNDEKSGLKKELRKSKIFYTLMHVQQNHAKKIKPNVTQHQGQLLTVDKFHKYPRNGHFSNK